MTDAFHPAVGTTVSLAATATTGSVKLGAPRSGRFQVRIHNKGPNMAFVAQGTSTVTAVTTDMPIPVGAIEVFTFNNVDIAQTTHVAAICAATETATLYFTLGAGV